MSNPGERSRNEGDAGRATSARRRSDRIRAIANWVNLSTPLGLAIAKIGGATLRRRPRLLWVAEGYRLRFPQAGAFTVGSVVIVCRRCLADLERSVPRILQHEANHADQWALCAGLPFLPAYLIASLWSWVRTGTLHGANVFEVRANLGLGGYVPAPPRRQSAGGQASR